MAHPNEDAIRRGFAAFAAGDLEQVSSLLAPDVTWHAPGRHALAGDHRGRDRVIALLTGVSEMTGGTIRHEIHDVLVNDEHAVVLSRMHGERGGRSVHDNHVLVFHMRDGLVTEVWGHPRDQYALDELLSS